MSTRRWFIFVIVVVAALAVTGFLLANAPGVHWYNNWTSFAFFLDNSNWPPYFLAALLPGVFIYGWTHWLHRKQMTKMVEHHDSHMSEMAKMHETLGRIHLNGIRNLHATQGYVGEESSPPDPVQP